MSTPNQAPRLPGGKDRTAIVGRTGSGKTQDGIYLLSRQNLRERPWIVLDFKSDELINSIDRARHITYSKVPTEPGLYILHPRLNETEQLDEYLMKVYERRNIGVYVDEGYMLDKCESFDILLTQGRSLMIPMIVLAQRPVWISRFTFSEATFIQVFDLTDTRDLDTVAQYIPHELPSLPDFHSWYYDVQKKSLTHFSPVPEAKIIRAKINAQLGSRSI